MADNVTVNGVNYSTDDVTSLNGATIAAGTAQTQRIKVQHGADGVANDVSSASPMPVAMYGSGGMSTVSGTISAAAANTAGTAVTASTTGQVIAATQLAGNATFHIVTSAFVGTLVFEGSVDGGLNYGPIIAIREDGTGSEQSLAISTAAYFIRQYTVALPGFMYFRVRCSAFTSGTAAIVIAPGPFLVETTPSLGASTAQIGTVAEMRAGTTFSTATGASGAAVTLTLGAPGAGIFHYLTSLAIDLYSAAARTGSATPIVVTSTNLAGSPAWTFSTAGAIGAVDRYFVPFTTANKAAAANTATTIVAPAVTGGIWRLNVTGFVAA